MAIREENKKVQDNMDYKSEKEKMQEENTIKKVDVFNLRDYFKVIVCRTYYFKIRMS